MGVQSLYLLSVILHIPQSRVLPSPSFLCTCLPHLTAISFHLTLCSLPLFIKGYQPCPHSYQRHSMHSARGLSTPPSCRLSLPKYIYISIVVSCILFGIFKSIYYTRVCALSLLSFFLYLMLSRYSPSSSISCSLFIPPSEHSCLLVQQPCIIISHKIKQK